MIINNQLFLKPSLLLNDFVDHYWFTDIFRNEPYCLSDHYQVHLPMGCVDWYFCYQNSSYETQIGNKKFKTSHSILTGTRSIDKIIILSSFSIPFRGIRIRFKPHGFFRIFRIPADELYNNIYLTDEVLGNEIRGTHYKLEHVSNHYERKEYLDQYLIHKLKNNPIKEFKIERCLEAFKEIHIQSGNIRVPALLKQLNISERSLERDFKMVFGLAPKELCETYRLNNVIRELLTHDQIDWNDLIYNYGYYDQAHFINEFKKTTTVTPDWLIKNKNKEVVVYNGLLIFLTNEPLKEVAKTMIAQNNIF